MDGGNVVLVCDVGGFAISKDIPANPILVDTV